MLYLEDFLEMIEQLPCELRDRSTEMRMLDLQVQRGIDQNNKVIADFFQQAPSLSQEQRDQWYMKIKEDFQKIRDQAEEKVSIADAMYSLVEKYHNRLTREVMHFKYELEADSPGITETIERKLQDAERANIATRRERKRKAKILEALQEARAAEMGQRASTSSASSWNGQPAHNDPTLPPPPLKLPNIKRAQTFPKQLVEARSANSASSSNLAQKTLASSSGSSFDPLMTKTPQVSPLALPTGAAMPAFSGSESRHGRPRKLTSRVQEMLKDTMHRHERTARPPTFSTDSDEDEGSDDGDELEHEDAKRTWCICNQKSFGDMVACDSKDCPFEWFHYHCVGIKEPPKGKWFCPHCTEAKLRKNIPVV